MKKQIRTPLKTDGSKEVKSGVAVKTHIRAGEKPPATNGDSGGPMT